MSPEARTPTDEEFRSFDVRSLNNGVLPYRDDDTNAANYFQLGASYFRNVVREKTGFTGAKRVLDLLCGFGMWSIFLAEVNDEVVGFDRDRRAIDYGRELLRHYGVGNVDLSQGDVKTLAGYPDNHFDLVWFYSGPQYVERGFAFEHVQRVLVPGGRVFVGNYTSTGLMLDHVMNGARAGTINEGVSQWALRALVRGPDADGHPNYADVETCPALCERFGLRLVAASAQGGLDMRLGGVDPAFKPEKRFDRYALTIELIAEKP